MIIPTCDELLDRAMREVQAKEAEIEDITVSCDAEVNRLRDQVAVVSRSNNDLAEENKRLRTLVKVTREALRDHYETEIATIKRDYEFILELDQNAKRAEDEDQ